MHTSSSPSQNGSSYTYSSSSHGFSILQWFYREPTFCNVYLHQKQHNAIAAEHHHGRSGCTSKQHQDLKGC